MSHPSEPTDPIPPRVLFVGDDASSPQIAASLLRDVAGDRISVDTAGTRSGDPGGRSDEMLVAMGLNPAEEKRLSSGTLYTADHVVVLGTEIDVARLPGPSYQEWDLERNDLIAQVEALSDALTTAIAGRQRSVVLRWLPKLRKAIRRVGAGHHHR